MEWFSARIGDAVAMRVLMDAIRDELGRANLAGQLPPAAQIYVVTEADDCLFRFNAAAARACPSLERLGAPPDRPPHESERVNPLVEIL